MVDYLPPNSWATPEWHPDYGDARAELEHLRTSALCLIEQVPHVSVGLSMPEEGLMFLVVRDHHDVILAEVYSIPVHAEALSRKYGVFVWPDSAKEEEHYAMSVQGVIDLVSSIV